MLFEGESTDWLVEALRVLLGQQADMQGEDLEDAVLKTLNTLKELQQVRNVVVHGTWSYKSPWAGINRDEDFMPVPRPWGDGVGKPRDKVYYCHRSKRRRYGPEQLFTIADVLELARRLNKVTDMFDEARSLRTERIRAWRPPSDKS